MGLLKAVLAESEAFRKAYVAAVPEKKKVRSILTEASADVSNKLVYGLNSFEFKEAIKQIPTELIDLIYNQLKVEPVRLVEIADDDSQNEFNTDSNTQIPSAFEDEENIENDDD